MEITEESAGSFYDSYNDTLDLKLRGFILKLFSAAEPHSHTITFTHEKTGKTNSHGA